jgi:hypothetical protein
MILTVRRHPHPGRGPGGDGTPLRGSVRWIAGAHPAEAVEGPEVGAAGKQPALICPGQT